VPKREGYARFCSLARGLDIVGERWTLVVLQELLHSARRYSELRGLLPGIGSNVLSDRLRSLEGHGLIERVPRRIGEGVVYVLTARGRQLGPAMAMFRHWGLDELLPPANEPDPYPLFPALGGGTKT
jgi:DNA-binding HxlR family transcriptional regulator